MKAFHSEYWSYIYIYLSYDYSVLKKNVLLYILLIYNFSILYIYKLKKIIIIDWS